MRSPCTALVFCVLLSVPAAAQTVWEMPTEYPASAMPGQGVSTFAEQVAQRSDGRLVIKPSFDAEKGIKSAEMMAAVQEGRVEAGDAFGGTLQAVDPVFGLSSLPFVATSLDDARRLAVMARPIYEAAFAERGQRLLYLTPWPASGIWSKEPLASVEDLRALAIRTYDATSTAVMDAAGAEATRLSWSEALPELRSGSVNAALTSGDGGAGRQLWDMLPYFTEVNYAFPLSFATVNAAAYQALTPDLRAAVDAAATATEEAQWAAMGTRVADNYARMRDNGVTIETTVPADLQRVLAEAADGVVEAWKRDAPAAAEVLRAYHEER